MRLIQVLWRLSAVLTRGRWCLKAWGKIIFPNELKNKNKKNNYKSDRFYLNLGLQSMLLSLTLSVVMVHTYSVVPKTFASVIASVLNLSNYVSLGHDFITLKTLQTSSIHWNWIDLLLNVCCLPQRSTVVVCECIRFNTILINMLLSYFLLHKRKTANVQFVFL